MDDASTTPADSVTPGHTVRTSHVQRLIRNGLALAAACDGVPLADRVPVEPGQRIDNQTSVYPYEALMKAADDLNHAADELRAEAHSCAGWAQV